MASSSKTSLGIQEFGGEGLSQLGAPYNFIPASVLSSTRLLEATQFRVFLVAAGQCFIFLYFVDQKLIIKANCLCRSIGALQSRLSDLELPIVHKHTLEAENVLLGEIFDVVLRLSIVV
ncbi:hypothetical protein AVEN_34948-1 [Araneus ventricosus]|uniref:Uncharacterized protein n=1 Tax=Araneus ventricosus TaxID=182803 RepID=A0A4Y2PU72_ARAVE|nr:hypothetical protein AVEN_140423-1 [Araneus ventricosus]GBN54208.1 hypothetical protein AVEN_34948-1 [Araneus ventricosus]